MPLSDGRTTQLKIGSNEFNTFQLMLWKIHPIPPLGTANKLIFLWSDFLMLRADGRVIFSLDDYSCGFLSVAASLKAAVLSDVFKTPGGVFSNVTATRNGDVFTIRYVDFVMYSTTGRLPNGMALQNPRETYI